MAILAAIQLSENAAAVIRVIDIGEQVKRLWNASQFSDGLGERGVFCRNPRKGIFENLWG